MEDKLKALSKGRTGKLLLEVCADIKRQVADIRTPLKVRAEIQNEVRLGIIEAIDVYLADKIKILGGMVEPQDPNEYT